jgi:DNA-binding transcriptional ArsR family regulator
LGTSSAAVRLDPAAVLFGSTRRRVLAWLLGHADKAYYLRELGRYTGTAVSAVQRELEQLTAAGLVRRDVRGNQVYFQVNREAPIFPELNGLFAKTVLAESPTDHPERGEAGTTPKRTERKQTSEPARTRQRRAGSARRREMEE